MKITFSMVKASGSCICRLIESLHTFVLVRVFRGSFHTNTNTIHELHEVPRIAFVAAPIENISDVVSRNIDTNQALVDRFLRIIISTHELHEVRQIASVPAPIQTISDAVSRNIDTHRAPSYSVIP